MIHNPEKVLEIGTYQVEVPNSTNMIGKNIVQIYVRDQRTRGGWYLILRILYP